MAAIKVTEGSVVKVKGTGRTGKVLTMSAQKVPGKRGRPPTVAVVIDDFGLETTHGVRELQLV